MESAQQALESSPDRTRDLFARPGLPPQRELEQVLHPVPALSNVLEVVEVSGPPAGVLRPIEDYRARSGDSYNISLLKAALRLTGRDFGPPRPPQRAVGDAAEAEIRALLAPILAAEADLAG